MDPSRVVLQKTMLLCSCFELIVKNLENYLQRNSMLIKLLDFSLFFTLSRVLSTYVEYLLGETPLDGSFCNFII